MMIDSGLFTGRMLAAYDASGSPPWDWLPSVFTAFEARIRESDAGYPCYFGVRGQQDGNNWFTAVDDRATGAFQVADLASSLVEFRRQAWAGPKRQSLVVFVGPPRPAYHLDADIARFWSLLALLTAHDPTPWPVDRPSDPRDPAWQWCFAGEPWFTFMCSPAYRARLSRNLGPCLTLIFQTRRVFDGLSGESVAGQAAKARIRSSLLAYDRVPAHPHLGGAGASSSFKWRQYALPDDQTELPPENCPWAVHAPGSVDGTGT